MTAAAVAKKIPYSVEKRASTGTREMRTIERSIESIEDTLKTFVDTVMRTGDKDTKIAAALDNLAASIREQGLTEENERILDDLDARIFEEQVFTEKCNKGVIRMTDDTKFSQMKSLAEAAAKIAATKFKMSAGNYVPKADVVDRGQKTVDMCRSVLNEYIGPRAADDAMGVIYKAIAQIWGDL